MRILIYQKIVRLGGTFTFDFNFIQKFKGEHEITYMYEGGENELISKIGEHVQTVQNRGQVTSTDLCIYSSIFQGAHQIKASKYVQMIHMDFQRWHLKYKPVNIDLHVAVGEKAMLSFQKLFEDYPIVHIDNMLSEPKVDKVLKLVTASRIAEGKGFDRVVKMARMLKEWRVRFEWKIYGDGGRHQISKLKHELVNIPEVVLMGVRDSIHSYMIDADYVVQLSDSEGFCYSIYEALQIGIPVIVTNWNGLEVVVDGKNGYILDMDLKNLDKRILDIPRPERVQQDDSAKMLWDNLFLNLNINERDTSK